MDVKQFAAMLNGREYMNEISGDECKLAKKLGFVVVFGASDDLVELRGAIHDEIDAYDGTDFDINSEGFLADWENFLLDEPSEEEALKWFKSRNAPKSQIVAKWDVDGFSWVMSSDAKSQAEFVIYEDGDTYCKGLVIDLSQLQGATECQTQE